MADQPFIEGRPRTADDYRMALKAVEARLVRPIFTDPELFVQLPTIREGLLLLIRVLEKAAEIRER
jgi:hypothetical protein